MNRKTNNSNGAGPSLRTAVRFLVACVALLALLVACSTSPAPAPRAAAPSEPAQAAAPVYNPLAPPKGPVRSLPLHLTHIPEALDAPMRLLPQAQSQIIVEMRALLVSAYPPERTEEEPSQAAWVALLEQTGMPYEHIVATDPRWTPEALADYLVGTDGVGRFQAILLTSSNLAHKVEDQYPPAFVEAQWQVLFDYQRAYGVRQVSLYGSTSPWSNPAEDDPGMAADHDGRDLDGERVLPTPHGLAIFDDISADSTITLHATFGYPGIDAGGWATPLLEDSAGNVLAVLLQNHGRERISLFFDNAAWFGVPVAYTQQLGASLLRWAMRGVHLGERRNSFQADIDDWFLPTDRWNIETKSNDGPEFQLSASDARSLRDQQAELRAIGDGLASQFTWTMAFNGAGASGSPVPATCVEDDQDATLAGYTRCLVDDFWWVSHTWDHEYMDYIPDVGRNLDTRQIVDNLARNDDLAAQYGFGGNYSRNSLVTGDISGLGWYDPRGPELTPEAKVDHGLRYSSPYLVEAAVQTDHVYLASNMSTQSHEPDCWGCGIYLSLDDNVYNPRAGVEVFLVPRWPTNIFATVATPEDVVSAYNYYYGENGILPEKFEYDSTFDEILERDAGIGLGHALSGSPYAHYFHVPNAHEYATGRSLLSDWTSELFTRYADLVTEPLLSYRNDELAAYVKARTDFRAAGVSGTWNRTTGEMTITSANGGPVFLTGGSLGAGATDFTYHGRNISQRDFAPGQSVTIVAGDSGAPAAPVISAFTAAPSAVVEGATITVSWTVFGPHDDIQLMGPGDAELGIDLPATGSRQFQPLRDTTYELIVTWGGRSVTKVATVAVRPAAEPSATTFSAEPASVAAGHSSTLSWVVEGDATSIALREAGGATLFEGLEASGSQVVTPTATTTYELIMAWPGGAAVSATTTVTVTPPAEPGPDPDPDPDPDPVPDPDPAPDPDPIIHTLTLQVTGGGFGLVIGSPSGQSCIDACKFEVPAGTTLTLTPVALLGSTFEGFSGSCTQQSCSLVINADLKVGARFEFKD